MNPALYDTLLKSRPPKQKDRTIQAIPPLPLRVQPTNIAYEHNQRGLWVRPEYDFEEIQIAQDTDSFIFRAIQKKVNKIIVAGYEFVGNNAESVRYIKERWQQVSYSINTPGEQLLWTTFASLFTNSNCIWAKVRNEKASEGNLVSYDGVIVKPVAGYFILPMDTIELKTKKNGEIVRVKQVQDGASREWHPRDIVHFYNNKKPGFMTGTPELLPALDDVALLRRIEENVETLIETNLFPMYHYKIGTDAIPEREGPDGTTESAHVRKTLQKMRSGEVYVSDHRHEITAIGSEGKALRIDFYLGYFKSRVLAALGTSAVDMGETDSANKSTASTTSKGLMLDVEAMARIVESFFNFFIITELLLEGGYNPLDEDEQVRIRFGIIDKDDRRADENQQIQLFTSNLITVQEARKALGLTPWEEENVEDTFYKMYEEPLALVSAGGPGTAANAALAEHPSSNLSPEGVAAEKQMAIQEMKAKAAGKAKTASKSARKTSAARARPSNQHGKRSSPKTNRDCFSDIIDSIEEVDETKLAEWIDNTYKQYTLFDQKISLETIALTTAWRIRKSS